VSEATEAVKWYSV